MIQIGATSKTGLTKYQELCWLSAIKHYGATIMDKSLLSAEQKNMLLEMVNNNEIDG
jgi:hypothetical protein